MTPAELDDELLPPLIETGWLIDGACSAAERESVFAARKAVERTLSEAFPQFRWRMPCLFLPASRAAGPDEPASRLHQGVQERDSRGWDFALLITSRDLRSYYKSYALAVPSRALAVAVISLARLGAFQENENDLLARRIAALVLHVFGDLNGVWHSDDLRSAMHAPNVLTDLDGDRSFATDEVKVLEAALGEVADLRLEESSRLVGPVRFYVYASMARAREIGSAVIQAKPWEFPLRLSGLTTAALSALVILLMTAEVWDLATSQTATSLLTMSILVIFGTTIFILVRQKLLLRRARGLLSEQAVVMNVSATVIVLLGMLSTYLTLFGLTVAFGMLFFDAELLLRWAPGSEHSNRADSLMKLGGMISSFGLLIGSLGASFEQHHYFRHIIYADEET